MLLSGLSAGISGGDATIQNKIYGSGTTTLIISNKEMENVMKVVQNNAVCYSITLNPGFSVSINVGGNLCWHVVLSWCFTSIRALLSLCFKRLLSFCLRAQHSDEESIIPMTQLLYI